MALTNKDDDHKNSYKEILAELVKERFDEIKELTNETNQMKLKEAKKLQNVFKIIRMHWKMLNCFTNHEKLL